MIVDGSPCPTKLTLKLVSRMKPSQLPFPVQGTPPVHRKQSMRKEGSYCTVSNQHPEWREQAGRTFIPTQIETMAGRCGMSWMDTYWHDLRNLLYGILQILQKLIMSRTSVYLSPSWPAQNLTLKCAPQR